MENEHFRHYDRATDTTKYEENAELVNRPGYNTQGKAILVRVNQYKVTKVPSLDVYQYDVSSNFSPSSTFQTDHFSDSHW